jgi:hypothetical protein
MAYNATVSPNGPQAVRFWLRLRRAGFAVRFFVQTTQAGRTRGAAGHFTNDDDFRSFVPLFAVIFIRSQLGICANRSYVRMIPYARQHVRRLGNALGAGVLFGGAYFLAVKRTDPRREGRFQLLRPVGRKQAGRVNGAAKPLGRPTRAGRFEFGDRDRGIPDHLAPGMQHGLGAVETIRRLPENFQGVFFHSYNALLLFTDH